MTEQKNTIENSNLESNINTFMESQASEYDLGKENYYCSNILYGYDSKYAYAWVYCSGFTIKSNGELEQGTAFSVPIRLEYTQPHFEIINYKQPGDGSLYSSTLQELFSQEHYDKAIVGPSKVEIEKLDQNVKNKTKSVIQIKKKFSELRDYPSNKLPPRSIIIEESQNDLFIAFIQNGSGRPILEARCFLVKSDGTIIDNGKSVPGLDNNDNLYFSARECK